MKYGRPNQVLPLIVNGAGSAVIGAVEQELLEVNNETWRCMGQDDARAVRARSGWTILSAPQAWAQLEGEPWLPLVSVAAIRFGERVILILALVSTRPRCGSAGTRS